MTSDDQPQADQSKINGIGHQATADQTKPECWELMIYDNQKWIRKTQYDALRETGDALQTEFEHLQKRCEVHQESRANLEKWNDELVDQLAAAKAEIERLKNNPEIKTLREKIDKLDGWLNEFRARDVEHFKREQKLVKALGLVRRQYTLHHIDRDIIDEALKEIKGE